MNRAKSILPGVVALLFVVVALPIHQSQAQAQSGLPDWAQVTGVVPEYINLTAVFMMDENNAWVAGNDGDNIGFACKLVRGRERWSMLACQQFGAALNSIVAVSDKNVWAVGENGLIAHLDDGTWREEPNNLPVKEPSLPVRLTTLQMLGEGSEGWAAGYRRLSGDPKDKEPVLLHYKEGKWIPDNSITGRGGIDSLHFAQGGGWAVGEVGIWHYRSSGWQKEDIPPTCGDFPGCYPTLSSVRAVSADESWIVGSRIAICGICVSLPYALHRTGGQWHLVLPDAGIEGSIILPSEAASLTQVAFTDSSFGLAVGYYFKRDADTVGNSRPLALRYSEGKWRFEKVPEVPGPLVAVSVLDTTHALAVGPDGLLMSYGYGDAQSPSPTPSPSARITPTARPTTLPTTLVADPHDPSVSFFTAVGHTLRGNLRSYWLKYGGLPQFGYPLTEQFIETSPTDGKQYTVQYFERARFEYHPENKPPYDVLLGLLGNTVTEVRKSEDTFKAAPPQPKPGVLYFKETGHNVPPQFVGYWQTHGGLPVYGYPISEAFIETSLTDGKNYLVQYFERNWLEYHPELPEPFRVSLGLLGVDVLRACGWTAP